ncbi:selenide, water dikinase SelD [soil metagenome]
MAKPRETAGVSERSERDHQHVRLTEWTDCGGCAAKWGASLLSELVGRFDESQDGSLLVGLSPFDDAAVYRVSDDVAMVTTTDFFPPLVDDPDDFGAIAAANACSDVFAMGGRVVLALNVAAFPEHFPPAAIAAIFDAAARVVGEAGGSIGGGHTIRNPEPVFGLVVNGLVHPDRVFRKGGAQPGDVLVCSKPVGTALALASGDPSAVSAAIAGMRRTNREACARLVEGGNAVHAVTDVTGYGLGGHAWELAERSGVRVVIDADSMVAYPGAREAAARGVRSGGDARNREYVRQRALGDDETAAALCFDPQTSGGLLAAVDPGLADDLVGETVGAAAWWRVGIIAAGEPALELR